MYSRRSIAAIGKLSTPDTPDTSRFAALSTAPFERPEDTMLAFQFGVAGDIAPAVRFDLKPPSSR